MKKIDTFGGLEDDIFLSFQLDIIRNKHEARFFMFMMNGGGLTHREEARASTKNGINMVVCRSNQFESEGASPHCDFSFCQKSSDWSEASVKDSMMMPSICA